MITKTEVIAIWDGENLSVIVSILVTRNTEMKIRTMGPKRKLVIKDEAAGFYRCIPIGDEVEIPKYENPISVEDEYEEEIAETTKQ